MKSLQEIRLYMHYEKHTRVPEYALLEALGFDKNKDKISKLLEELKKKPQSSVELSKNTKLTRSTINYYLDILMNRGLVYYYDHKFYLAGSRFTQIIQYMEIETTKTMQKLKELAKEIDSEYK